MKIVIVSTRPQGENASILARRLREWNELNIGTRQPMGVENEIELPALVFYKREGTTTYSWDEIQTREMLWKVIEKERKRETPKKQPEVPSIEDITESDEKWIEEVMKTVTEKGKTDQDIEKIVFTGLKSKEQACVLVGIRLGRHSAARMVMTELRCSDAEKVARKIDKYMSTEKQPR